jgi:hypothetical protein
VERVAGGEERAARPPRRVVGGGSVDEDERRSVARPEDRNGDAVRAEDHATRWELRRSSAIVGHQGRQT